MKLAALLCLVALSPKLAASDPGFAVVELFTSEGCSSCPPADKVLADLAADAARTGRPVYALEFHVDYWNSLGWRDPFSAAAYSDRQRAYAEALGEDQVYTPQMIVNGTNAFVGSNGQRADAAIAAGLGAPVRVKLSLELTRGTLAFRTTNAPRGARMCLAVVDAPQVVRVGRGENSGRSLRHARVVRAFASRPLDADGFGMMELPAPVPRGGAIVAWVQAGEAGAILAAGAF